MRTADYYNVSFLVSGESAGPALAVFGEMSGKISYYARVSQRERGENGIFVFIYIMIMTGPLSGKVSQYSGKPTPATHFQIIN